MIESHNVSFIVINYNVFEISFIDLFEIIYEYMCYSLFSGSHSTFILQGPIYLFISLLLFSFDIVLNEIKSLIGITSLLIILAKYG